MSESFDNHVLEEIPVYLAGGLAAAEREQFDAHIQSCPTCSAALVDAQAIDDSVRTLFKDAAPRTDFEDRLIARFRQKTTVRTLHPMVRRAAIGVAASILLGGVGLGVNRKIGRMEQGRVAFDSPPAEASPVLRDERAAHFSSYRDLQGQNMLNGDGHVETGAKWQSENFALQDKLAPVLSPTENGPGVMKALNRREVGRNQTDEARLTSTPIGNRSPITLRSIDAIKLSEQFAVQGEQNKSFGYATHALTPTNGPVTLNGTNGYTGGTTVVAGTLNLNGGSGFGVDARGGGGSGGGGGSFGRGGGRGGGGSGGTYAITAAPTAQVAANDQQQAHDRRAPVLEPPPAASAAPTPPEQAQQKSVDDTAKKAADVSAEESPPAALQPVPASPPASNDNAVETRKIIREGTMSFEVDSFDSTVMTIGKIVAEEGGFVATTDSDKLANGKVSGTVVVRVPPDHLDTVVLKLRGIGDLKSQKITAQDITKQYTDLESELRAAQAMQDRLLDIIKNAKGAVKDLLEAEKQLGVWREKIEQVEGEIRYDNNLISLSTLSVSLVERDIKSAAFSSINEQITMALETEKVEDDYNAARDAIANAKGRIVQSELKQYEAGQFGATIRAQLPPDAADAVIGRLRQLDGRLANFQRLRSQSNEEGTVAPLDSSKVKREDVTLNFTIYNLANIEPRRTTSLMLAANNVEDAYSAILEQATAAGARVVTSNINRPQPNQSTASIQLQVPSDKADALLLALRGSSELISQESTENPDTQNVTNAKRGIVVQIVSLAAMTPRRSTNLTVAAPDVDAAYRLVLDKVSAAGGRIVASGVNRGNPEQTNASVNFQVPTEKADALLAEVRGAGELMRQDTTEDPNAQNTTDAKRGYQLQIVALAGVPARQSEQLQVAASDVPAAFNAIIDALHAGDARIIASQLNQQDPANIGGAISFEMTRPARAAIDGAIDKAGEVISRNLTRSLDTDNTVDNKVRVDLTMGSASQLPPRETTTLGVEVSDVQKAVDDVLSAATDAGGREIDKDISQDQKGRTVAHVIVEVPLDKSDSLSDQIGQMGHQRVKEVSRNPQAPQGQVARGRFEVTFADASTALGGEETAWDAIRHGLAVSGMGLRWSAQMIVVGLCFVVPWVLLVWGGWKLLRYRKNRPRTAPTASVQ